MPRVVGDEPDTRGPADPSGRVPEEESPPFHVADAGDPRSRVAQHGDEAAEEDDLPAVARHQRLGARKDPVRVAAEPRPPPEERPPAEASDQPVAEVVPDDRPGRGEHDHPLDRVVALRGQHAERDQRRLTRQRDSERLQHHDHEQERQAVMGQKRRHRCSP